MKLIKGAQFGSGGGNQPRDNAGRELSQVGLNDNLTSVESVPAHQTRHASVGSAALRVVERTPFYEESTQICTEDGAHSAHSLHDIVPYPEATNPDLPAYFIQRYTKKGGVVLDPFCGCGTTPLEAAMAGRIPYGSDISPLATSITLAKLFPSDIAEVTLRLQKVSLRRPLPLELYRERFASFFDIDTYREIANLRGALITDSESISRFVQVVTMGILHGHTAGFLSAYSFPQVSLSSEEQEQLNVKRRQSPDYRALTPRVLKKTAMVLRDGIPSILQALSRALKVATTDARNLAYCESNGVDLYYGAPPLPGDRDYTPDLWMRYWFGQKSLPEGTASFATNEVDRWLDYMNEVLFEAARVVKPGGRAVLQLKDIRSRSEQISLDGELRGLVAQSLGRFWEPECLIVNAPRAPKLRNAMREREGGKASSKLLVLRRR